MTTSIVYREYVRDNSGIESVYEAAERLLKARGMTGWECGIAADVSYDNLDELRLDRLKAYLDMRGIKNSFPRERQGAGGNTYKALLEMFETDTRIMTDIGDTDVDDPEVIERMQSLGAFLREHDAVLGLGSKSYVHLAEEPELEETREIHEVFFATFAQDSAEPLYTKEEARNLPPMYKSKGYLFPGTYAVNSKSTKFQEFRLAAENVKDKIDMKIFAFEYYIVMRTSKMGRPMPVVIIPTKKEMKGTKRSRKQIEDIIIHDSRQILKTDVGADFEKHMRSIGTEIELVQHYNPVLVNRVKRLMLDA